MGLDKGMRVHARGSMAVLYYPKCQIYLYTRHMRGCDACEVIAVQSGYCRCIIAVKYLGPTQALAIRTGAKGGIVVP